MRVLFPADPATPGRVHPDWVEESAAAAEEGVASAVVDLEALANGDDAAAIRRVRPSAGEVAIYRGPELDADAFARLAAALADRGLSLDDGDAARSLERASTESARRAAFRRLRERLS